MMTCVSERSGYVKGMFLMQTAAIIAAMVK
jgi:hypothetical protein